MKIKTMLQIITILSIGLALAVGLTLFLTNRQMIKTSQICLTSDMVVKGVAELEIVTHDYLLHHEDRAKKQWLSKHESLSELLKTAKFISPEEKNILGKLLYDHKRVRSIFTQLITTYEKMQTLDQKAGDICLELEERLTSQLLLKLQAVILGAFRFGEASHANMVTVQQRTGLLIIVFVGIMAAIISAILLLIGRSFVKPIARLQEGTRIIGTGNLDYKVGTVAKDEIGYLSRAFDRMTEELKAISVSRDKLAEEVSQRKRAEERINHLNMVLKAIRGVNQIIVREKDRDRLIKSVCDNLTVTRGYHNAWIALFDESRRLVTTAEAGLGKDFLPMIELLKSGELMDCGQMALGQSGVVPIEDPSATCTNCPLSGKYHGRAGMRARLENSGKIYGLLTVSISRDFLADKEEQALFKEVAGDIALALHGIELEQKQKQAEEALQKSEEKYRVLFEDSRDAIYITTLNGKLVDANQSFLDLFGYTREDMRVTTARQLYVNPDDGRRFREEIEQKGSIKDFEVKLKKKDGKEMDCLFTVSVWRAEDGSTIGYQGIIQNVTEQRKLQAQFFQAQKMEAIGRLAGGVAHDFNNMLTSIIGYADFLLMGLSRDDDLRKDVQEIKKAADRAAALTSQLLAFSRKQVIQPRVVNLNDEIEDMLQMLRRLIGEDVALVAMLEPKLGLVKADPSQMEQVVMNLAVNARDAMPRGGKLTIETANVDLDLKYFRNHGLENVPGPYVMLSVSDNGIGIDKKIQSLIFDPFFTTKEKGKGTGLGLATVYGIVKQSEGYVWAYSELGKGTTFKIYLPRATEDKSPLPKEDVPQTFLQGSETVLVVEDEAAVRNLAVKVLHEYGYRVLEAQDGESALKISLRHADPIHLLLTDVVMPGMSGRELAEQLTPSRPEMKVLYMSGYTDNAIAEHGILDEGVAYLSKPFTLEGLALRVREMLDEGRKDKGRETM